MLYILAFRLKQKEPSAARPVSPTSTLLGAGRPGLQEGMKGSLLAHTERGPESLPSRAPFHAS